MRWITQKWVSRGTRHLGKNVCHLWLCKVERTKSFTIKFNHLIPIYFFRKYCSCLVWWPWILVRNYICTYPCDKWNQENLDCHQNHQLHAFWNVSWICPESEARLESCYPMVSTVCLLSQDSWAWTYLHQKFQHSSWFFGRGCVRVFFSWFQSLQVYCMKKVFPT